jgi:hypothetical protein
MTTRLLSLASRMKTRSSRRPPGPEALEGHRRAQRLAYECAVAVGRELREGMTERQAAARLEEWMRDHGVGVFFHRPFAWFGERSAFRAGGRDFGSYTEFLPSERALGAKDVAILDLAPVVDGYVADVGYAVSLERHEGLERARACLRRLRQGIPLLFEQKLRPQEIWNWVDRELRQEGFSNCHEKYPFSVLAHRVYRLPRAKARSLTLPAGALSWFNTHTYLAFLTHGIFPELLGPFHQGEATGLWAVEPHLGGDGFGAKFEEILVVEKDRAYWLDDQVPHARG